MSGRRRSSRGWSRATGHRVLCNEKYVGRWVRNKSETRRARAPAAAGRFRSANLTTRALHSVHSEVPPRKRPTRRALEVALERCRPVLVLELDTRGHDPWSVLGRERGEAGVVCGESRTSIGGHAHITTVSYGQTPQDVDEALRHGIARVQTRDHGRHSRSSGLSSRAFGAVAISASLALRERYRFCPPSLRSGWTSSSRSYGAAPAFSSPDRARVSGGLPSRSSPRTGVRHPQASEGGWRRRESNPNWHVPLTG